MSSVNKVILVGNVGKEPEIRSLNSGDRCANLTLATSEKWRDRTTGESKEKTEWHKVVVFGDGLVKVVEQFVRKGSKLYVEGSLQTRKWTDKDGKDAYTTEIVLKPFRGEITLLNRVDGEQTSAGGNSGSYGGGSSQGQTQQQQTQRQAAPPVDDHIPF